MAKENRPIGEVPDFATTGAPASDLYVFGTTTESTDVSALIGPSSRFGRGYGFVQETNPETKPDFQLFNTLMYSTFKLHRHVYQNGMPDWSADETYYINSLSNRNGVIYRSKTDSNTGNDPATDTSETNWVNPNTETQIARYADYRATGAETSITTADNTNLQIYKNDTFLVETTDYTLNADGVTVDLIVPLVANDLVQWYDLNKLKNSFYTKTETNNTFINKDINALAPKATPVDADELILSDSTDSNNLKKLSWNRLKTVLKDFFDGLYSPIEGTLSTDNLLHIQERQATGVAGGSFVSGSRVKRDINVIASNTITGASLLTGQITLPIGDYWVEAIGIANRVNTHVLYLENITDTATVLRGSTQRSDSGTSNSNESVMSGKITVIGTPKKFEMQHQCSTTRNSDGFGEAAGFSVSFNVYAEIKIYKIG